MINLQALNRQQFQQVNSIFWRWFPKGVLNGKKTVEEKVEFALSLEHEFRSIKGEQDFWIFIHKLAILQQDGDGNRI